MHKNEVGAILTGNGRRTVPRVFTVVGTFVNTSRLDYLAKTAHAARGIANIH